MREKVVERFKADGRHEHRYRYVGRPRGKYDLSTRGDRYQVNASPQPSMLLVQDASSPRVTLRGCRGTAKSPPDGDIKLLWWKTSPFIFRWGRIAWKTRENSARFN